MLQHFSIRDKHCCFRDYAFSKTVSRYFSCVIWLVVCGVFVLLVRAELQSLTAVTGWLAAHLLLAEHVTYRLTVLSHYSMPRLNTLHNTHTSLHLLLQSEIDVQVVFV